MNTTVLDAYIRLAFASLAELIVQMPRKRKLEIAAKLSELLMR